MVRVIVVSSGKGGVGKTTVTANLGVCLARLGYKTVVIDADAGLRNLDILLGLENRIIYTAFDVLAEDCRIEQALIKDERLGDLILLTASSNRNEDALGSSDMLEIVNMLKQNQTVNYDFILIDSPAGIEQGFFTAIRAATESIIVTTPEIPAIRDADRVIGLLEANGIRDNKLVLNRVRPSMIKANNMMSVNDINVLLSIPLLGVLPEDETIIISTNRGDPLVLTKGFNLTKQAFENIALRLTGKDVDFLDLSDDNGNREGYFKFIRSFGQRLFRSKK
jgi:septum site-determining protein MinD